MASPDAGQYNDREHPLREHPLPPSSPISPDERDDPLEPPHRPVSPLSTISSIDEAQTRNDLRVEDIISLGPVRTIHVKRKSVSQPKPQEAQSAFAETNNTLVGDALEQARSKEIEYGYENREQHKRRWHERLGHLTIVALSLGTALIIAAFAFLCYLWLANDSVWRRIAVNNWMARATTISSVVVRAAVCFQAAALSAMIASIQLEKNNNRWSRSASLSMSRAAGRQPYTLLLQRIFSKKSWLLLALTVLLTIVNIALQFSSTILLSDLDVGPISTGDGPPTDLPYGLAEEQKSVVQRLEPNFARAVPYTFPAFAEYAQPPPMAQIGVDDTGETIRALLPIPQAATRASISSYAGHGTMMDSRVICMAPSVDNVTFISTGPSSSPAEPTQRVGGTINMGGVLPAGLIEKDDNGDIAPQDRNAEFSCSFQLAQVAGEWPVAMCVVDQAQFGLNSSSLAADETMSFVLLNHTANGTIPISAVVGAGTDTGVQSISMTEWNVEQDGAWSKLTDDASPDFELEISLCFAGLGAIDAEFEVNRDTTSATNEPIIRPGSSSNPFDLDMTELLAQFNAGNSTLDPSERGILHFTPQTPWSPDASNMSVVDSDFGFSILNQTYGLCTFCGSNEVGAAGGAPMSISYVLSSLFQQALKESGSPARAVQAMFTVARSQQYYSRLPFFTRRAPAVFAVEDPAYCPQHHGGLIAVGVLLLVHLIMVAVITALFLPKTKHSLLGQAWQSIAQVAADMDGETIAYASGATDKEVRAHMARRGGELSARLSLGSGGAVGVWKGEGRVTGGSR